MQPPIGGRATGHFHQASLAICPAGSSIHVATVKAFDLDGLKLWFWSNDHDPPHFHAKRRGEWEVKVKFLLPEDEMIELAWSTGNFPNRTIKALCKLAADNRAALLEEWEAVQAP